MEAASINPRGTHALLVGIERYADGGKSDLSGPVDDVLRFSRWLVGRGVPPEHLHLLLSPLERNVPALDETGLPWLEATLAGVSAFLLEMLPRLSGDVLWAVWSGHGAISSERDRR